MSNLTVLPPSEIALFRSIRNTVVVLLLLFRLDQLGRSPVRIGELATLLDISRKTMAEHLSSLAMLNLVARTGYHDGYLLTQGGRQLVLGSPVELLSGLPAGEGDEQCVNFTHSEGENDDQCVKITHSKGKKGEQCVNFTHSNATAVKAVKLVVKDISKDNLTTSTNCSSTPISENPLLVRHERMINVLAGTEVLWRDPILSQGLPPTDEPMVIAWIAQAWDQRDKLVFPQGMTYKALQKGRRPLARYRDHPERYLPADFFEMIGRDDLARIAKPVSTETEEEG